MRDITHRHRNHHRHAPLAIAILATAAAACTGVGERASAIDQLIEGIPDLPADPPSYEEGPAGPATVEDDYRCVTVPVAETRQLDELVAFSASSASLWPGAIIRGDSVYTGVLSELAFERAPLRFSISLENLAGAKSATLDDPSLASYREALGDILAAEVTGATPANIYAEIEEVQSEEHLQLALGASVGSSPLPAMVSASFDFEDQSVRSRYVVKFVQAYYTVDMDPPKAPHAFFADTVTPDDVAARVGPGNPPVYVSSITYGRMVLFTFESEYSLSELGAALDFTYKGGADVSGEVSVTHRDVVSRSNIMAYILGGSGDDAVQALGSYEDLIGFIEQGGNYSRSSPGAPIAYTLSYVKDNRLARLSFTSDYERRMCERISQSVRVRLEHIAVEDAGGDPGDDLEIYGTIAASGASREVLFAKDADEQVTVPAGAQWPTQGFAAEAVVSVTPEPGNAITLDVDLYDDDINADDAIGHEVRVEDFETGWRKEVTVLLTGGSMRVSVVFSLEPI